MNSRRRPDPNAVRAHFNALTDAHNRNTSLPHDAPLPAGVFQILGHVTDRTIVVLGDDGSTQAWRGGTHILDGTTTHLASPAIVSIGPEHVALVRAYDTTHPDQPRPRRRPATLTDLHHWTEA